MRASIERLHDVPGHFGLAYDVWTPVNLSGEYAGRIPPKKRDSWLTKLRSIEVDKAYDVSLERWRRTLTGLGGTLIEFELTSRLLFGHGNPSGSEVGLTVHHTWGAPLISGSSIKGVLQSHLVHKYGPWTKDGKVYAERHTHDANHPQRDRKDFQPVAWSGRGIAHGPGKALRIIFGAPDAESDQELRPTHGDEVGAARGGFMFCDALWVASSNNRAPWAIDIVNPHQQSYYGGKEWPNDWDSPIPVKFVTIQPGQRFVFGIVPSQTNEVLSKLPDEQREALVRFVVEELVESLRSHGIGAKTTSGYGRLKPRGSVVVQAGPSAPESPLLGQLAQYMDGRDFPPGLNSGSTQRELMEFIEQQIVPQLLDLDATQRTRAADLIEKKWRTHKKLADPSSRLAARLRG